MKLLVVDDSYVIRQIIKATIDVLQMETIEAQDGKEALEIITEKYKEIDLILMDWNMPEMNGYDVLVEIKKNNLYCDIPVLMVTTEGHSSSIIAAVKAGAANYLTKPFTGDELQEKILECVGKEADS